MVKELITDWTLFQDRNPEGNLLFCTTGKESVGPLMRFEESLQIVLSSDRSGTDDFRIELRQFEEPLDKGTLTTPRQPVTVFASGNGKDWITVGEILPEQQKENAHISFEIKNLENKDQVYLFFDNTLNCFSEGMHTQTINTVLLFRRIYDFEKEYLSTLRTSIDHNNSLPGPYLVQLDLTNNCNYNCLGCWCHSDLLDTTKLSEDEKQQKLSFETIEQIISDLVTLGTRKIMLAGSGEPLLHPQIRDIISLIKSHNIYLEIVTNFSLVTKEFADFLITEQVDKLTISLWSGDTESFLATHPNQTEHMFTGIKENMRYLNEQKTIYPETKIFNVISSVNAHKIEAMIQFGIDVSSDQIEFQKIDIVPGATDSLQLTSAHSQMIAKGFEKAKHKKGYMSVRQKWKNEELSEFGRYFLLHRLPADFSFSLESDQTYDAICQKGYHKHTCIDDNIDEKGLLFYFDEGLCKQCELYSSCSVSKEDFSVKAPYMSVLNYGHFMNMVRETIKKRSKTITERLKTLMRRSASSITPQNIPDVDRIPCYAGHIYSRVLVNGDVIPCCKAEKKPMGNVYTDSFKDIWYSSAYKRFRKHALTDPKSIPYFKPIDCYASCDNYGMNLQCDEMIHNPDIMD